MILFDVNVVVALFRADHPHHDVTRPWFDGLVRNAETFTVPDLVWCSFVRIVTHRRVFVVPASLAEAFDFVRAIREQPGHASVVPDEAHLGVFEELCQGADATGDLAVDAYLASIAIERGCSLASFNRDFARFEGLDWRIPA